VSRVIVTTSNAYVHLLPEFSQRFNHYWGEQQEVTVLCYDKMVRGLPANFTIVGLGKQSDFGKSWTDAMIPFFQSLKDKHFIHLLDDYYLTAKVDHNKLKMAEELMDKGADKFDLTRDRANNECRWLAGYADKVVMSEQYATYRTSLQAAIWKTEYFLKYLKPARTAWDFEVVGYREAYGDGAVILGTPGGILEYDNKMLKGGATKEAWSDNSQSLDQLLAARDISEFKKWKVVKKTMVVGKPVWMPIERDMVPESMKVEDNTAVHQAYHIVMLETLTGKKISYYDNIIEIGGGYGAMCKVLRDNGYTGDYTILDIPESRRLQEHYLSGYDVTLSDRVPEAGPKTLVLGMWSLSEISIADRERYEPLLEKAETVFLAAQENWRGVDNVEYFNNMRLIPIEHLQKSMYLVRENKCK